MIFRCIAHGMPCAVVQFIKGGMATGERDLIQTHFADLCAFHTMGEGFTWITQDKERDIAMARAGWDLAKSLIRDPATAWSSSTRSTSRCATSISTSPKSSPSSATRSPPPPTSSSPAATPRPELIEAADLATEMTLLKHPFRAGVKAQPGVEF